MCGGELEITEETSVCECEYCGSKQTIPTVDDEKIMKLYDRANRLRMANEFDKASGVYESIIEEADTEAEAYWGLLLCKFGIEYVDDPASGDKIPTCHRVSFDSLFDDSDFEMVMENADALSRTVYRDQAKQIEEIRKGIIDVSSKEEPYDIFICYKETTEDGDRTVDSVIAQDVYDALTDKGYRVFFSRITLEDKLGQEYEPYIFAALNSAKIMLAFGTNYDYYNAVWVKNEWSRFLKLMAKDKSKKLIPCYKDIDAYDMPKEFKHLQAQDMGKVGAEQDLIRGIDKILGKEKQGASAAVANDTVVEISDIIENYRVLAETAYEGKNYDEVENYVNKILEKKPNDSKAWFLKGKNAIARVEKTGKPNAEIGLEAWINSYNYASSDEKEDTLENINFEYAKLGMAMISFYSRRYGNSNGIINCQSTAEKLLEIVEKMFKTLPNKFNEKTSADLDFTYKKEWVDYCQKKISEQARDVYPKLISDFENNSSNLQMSALDFLNAFVSEAILVESSLMEYPMSEEVQYETCGLLDAMIDELRSCMTKLNLNDQFDYIWKILSSSYMPNLEKVKQECDYTNRKKESDTREKYDEATQIMKKAKTDKEYRVAEGLFLVIADYKDSKDLAQKCADEAKIIKNNNTYDSAMKKLQTDNIEEIKSSVALFESIKDWKDADKKIIVARNKIQQIEDENEKKRKKKNIISASVVAVVALIIIGSIIYKKVIIPKTNYSTAMEYYNAGDYDSAKIIFASLGDYKDARAWTEKCIVGIEEENNQAKYDAAIQAWEAGNYSDAISGFQELGSYKDSEEQINNVKQAEYDEAMTYLAKNDIDSKITASEMFEELGDYSDSYEKMLQALNERFIIEFCSGKYEKDNAASYFVSNVNNGNYKKWTSSEIEKNILGSWERVKYDGNIGYNNLTYNADGTVDGAYELDNEWSVKDNKLYLFVDYYIYEIDKEHILLFHHAAGDKLIFDCMYVRK